MLAVLVNSLAGGGAERVALTLLKEMHLKGQRTILICMEKESGYPQPDFCEVLYLTEFTKLHSPLIKTLWIFISAHRLSRILRDRQITYVQSHLNRANLINTGAKLFGSTHFAQIVFHTQLRFSSISVLRMIKKSFYRWLFTKADVIVSISTAMKDRMSSMLNLSMDQPKHVVIPNPHNIAEIQELAKESTSGFTFDTNKRYLISVGRQIKLKKVDLLIKALAIVRLRYPDVELIILGEGPAKSFHQEIASEENLKNQIHFLGHTRNPFAYISKSDLLVLASESEGLPNIIIEALACGVPVISSDCPTGPREILSPHSDLGQNISDHIEFAPYGILYPTLRPDLLAQAIAAILDDEPMRSKFRAAGLEYVHKYDQKRITERYLSHLLSGETSSKKSSQQ